MKKEYIVIMDNRERYTVFYEAPGDYDTLEAHIRHNLGDLDGIDEYNITWKLKCAHISSYREIEDV